MFIRGHQPFLCFIFCPKHNWNMQLSENLDRWILKGLIFAHLLSVVQLILRYFLPLLFNLIGWNEWHGHREQNLQTVWIVGIFNNTTKKTMSVVWMCKKTLRIRCIQRASRKSQRAHFRGFEIYKQSDSYFLTNPKNLSQWSFLE